jgi:hypothetical protein
VANEIEITVAADGSQSFDKIEKDAKRAGEGVEKNLTKGFKEAEKAGDKASKSIGDGAKKIDKAWSDAARGAKDALDDIEREARDSGHGMDQAMSEAVRSMRADLERLERQAQQSGGKLDSEMREALRKIRSEAQKTRKELDEALKAPDGGGFGESLAESFGGGFDIGGLIEGGLGKAGAAGGLATAGAAAGAMYADAMVGAFQDYWSRDRLGGIISAQQGGTVGDARRLGRVTGEAYYSGISDSVEDSAAALSGVLSQGLVDTGASEEELRRLTNMAATAATVVGEDAGRIGRAAKQLLINDMAGSAEQAIDIIVTASQRGVNVSGDMLDTLEEYAPQFHRLGLDGAEALGLINQMLQGGARNSDIAADTLKEFLLIASEGSDQARRGFESLGLGADAMIASINQGGPAARAALDEVVDRLKAVEDPVKRNQIALDLFGTKAEDAAWSLYSMDLDTVAGEMDGVAGATQRAQDVIAETEPPTDKLSRGFQRLSDGALGVAFSVLGVNEATESMSGTWERANGQATEFGTALDKSGDSASDAAGANEVYAASLDELISKQHEAVTGVIDFNDAQIDAQQAIQGASEAAKEFAGEGLNATKDGFDLTTEAGQELSKSLYEVADTTWSTVEAMQQQGKAQQEVQTYVEGSKNKFYQLARQMGIGERAAGRLADRLFDIPLNRKSTVDVNTARAEARLAIFRAAADIATRDRTMDIFVRSNPIAGLFLGGGKASGGITSGVWGAESGGQRHGGTLINEAGPELVELPSGSRVMTAGATRAMAERGLLGGGGDGVAQVVVSMDGADGVARALLKSLRVIVINEYGGDVQRALGKGAR